ncbi:hypothetical protein MMC21_000014 [Puttea exsequens]|nr:hypothetical protein [Puttea exsequens]
MAMQPQVDVSALSRQGLGAFTTVLATLSADNVMPMAILQMKNLGAMFHINGDFAEEVKNLLQRSPNVRLAQFALLLGWRKGDSTSLMTDPAVGQAISLLSLCLINVLQHNPSDVGLVLRQLSSKFLTVDMKFSSMSQLADVAGILAGKLAPVGFGGLLARKVEKIHQAYGALGQEPPKSLLGGMTVEFIELLLYMIGEAFRSDEKICRICRTQGMGYILGFIQALFPRSTTITVENVVIQSSAENIKIHCQISKGERIEGIIVNVGF